MNARIALVCLVASLALAGCHLKSPSSFVSATTPMNNTGKYAGDPGSAGGMGGANSGTRLGYSSGARANGSVAPGYDEPAKGSGTQPGENPGKGVGNGPVMQSKSNSSVSGRVKG